MLSGSEQFVYNQFIKAFSLGNSCHLKLQMTQVNAVRVTLNNKDGKNRKHLREPDFYPILVRPL